MAIPARDIDTPASAPGRRPLRVWVDIDNPPQVQYLLPVAHAFVRRGDEVRLTARDYGMTHELLQQRGETFEPVGRHFGGSLRAKILGTLGRAVRLWRLHRRRGVPDLVVSNSRSAALAASMLRIPSFAIIDYEFVNLAAFRLAGSYVVHPDVIPSIAFERRGMRPGLLLPFSGIKEHLTFADLDIDGVPPFALPPLGDGLRLVLVRPPAEKSHYHRAESTTVAKTLLARLATQSDVVVVFSARYPDQVDQLARHRFVNKPVVLERAVPFLSLLKAVDAVVSGGGTMIREAAYMGLPAITTFQGEPGAIDAYLESLGRLHVIRSAADVEALDVSSLERREAMSAAGSVTDEVASMIATASANHTRNGFVGLAA